MKSDVKACSRCDTINEKDAKFCRICRYEFSESEEENEVNQNEQQNPIIEEESSENAQNQQHFQHSNVVVNNQTNAAQALYGIPISEVSSFVGSGAATYIPKFIKKSATFKNAGFNVVVFLLGFFFGLIGSSFWFLHRKMYKIGIPVFVTGLIISIISFSLVFATAEAMIDAGIFEDSITSEYYGDQFDNESFYYSNEGSYSGYAYNETYPDEFTEELFDATIVSLMVSFLFSIISITLTVVLSIFADYWYMNHTVSKISKIKAAGPDNVEYMLVRKGGVNPIAWIIPLVIYLILNVLTVASLIMFIYQRIV